MQDYSLTVIVPVFNMVKYIRDCVDSLLEQDYENLNIVLVNDCSTDNTLEILKEYKDQNPNRITVIDSRENLRQGGARNLGLKIAKTEYVAFVDADDFCYPNMYSILMEEANRSHADAVYCGYQKVNEDTTYVSMNFQAGNVEVKAADFSQLSDESRMHLMASHEYGSVWGGVYRRCIIEENKLFFPEHLVYEDNFWVYAFQMRINTVSIIKRQLYCYRQQNASTIHKKNASHQYDRIVIGDILLRHVKEEKLLNRYHEIIEYLFIEVFTMNTFSILIKTFDEPDIEKLNQVKFKLKKDFPAWRNNRFYRELFSMKAKIKMNLLMALPSKMYAKLIR